MLIVWGNSKFLGLLKITFYDKKYCYSRKFCQYVDVVDRQKVDAQFYSKTPKNAP